MKNIIFRKILSDCLIFFFISLISVSIIIWVFQAVNYLDLMIEDGRSYTIYAKYTLLNFPKIIGKIVPFALFFSFTYVITKYELNNELIILWNVGINKIHLVNFLLSFSIIIVILQIIFTAIVIPKSNKTSRILIKQSELNFVENFIKPKRFNDTIKNLTIYTDEKKDNGTLQNIYIKKSLSNEKFQITFAQKGIVRNIGGRDVLVLFDGQTINGGNQKSSNFSFKKSDFNLSDFVTNTITSFKIQEISTTNLFMCIKNFTKQKTNNLFSNCRKDNLHNIHGELLKRLLIPFYVPLLVLISLFLITKSKEHKNFFSIRIVVFLIGFFTIIFSETSLQFAQDDLYENLKIIFVPFILIICLYFNFLFQFKFKHKKV